MRLSPRARPRSREILWVDTRSRLKDPRDVFKEHQSMGARPKVVALGKDHEPFNKEGRVVRWEVAIHMDKAQRAKVSEGEIQA